jgi:ABC-type polysaccharide/polyol phosphate transport system ATPase subunit
MTEPIIEVDHVTKRFTKWYNRPNSIKRALVGLLRGDFTLGNPEYFEVLNDVSFKIYPGEFVGIMGRNGVGKSTILKVISGIYHPTAGQVRVHGTIAPLLELGAGFHEELSGYENIFLNGAILGYGREEILGNIDKIVEFSELGDKIHEPVRNYSSGMLVRLGFAVAAHLRAPILLFDEVLAVGDAGFQQKCLKKIYELHAQGRTIILVSHDPEQIKRLCSRCIVIEKGRLIYDGVADKGTEAYLSNFHGVHS